MKEQNKSRKRYSSCVTINHCLLTFLIVISSVNYSHASWYWWTEPAAHTTEPPEERKSYTGVYYPTPTGFDYSIIKRPQKVMTTELPEIFHTTPPFLTVTPEEAQKTSEDSGELDSFTSSTTRPSMNPWLTFAPFTTYKAPEENTKIFGDAGRSYDSPTERLTTTSTTESTTQSQISYEVLVLTLTESDSKIFGGGTPAPDSENPVNCHADEFSCHSKRLCINKYLVCDGINDCDDGSDELMCEGMLQILSSEFICGNGECPHSHDPGQSPSACGQWNFSNIHLACKYEEEKVPSVVYSTQNALYETSLPADDGKKHVDKTVRFDLSGISDFYYDNNYDLLIWLDKSKNKIYGATFWKSLRKIGQLEIFKRQIYIDGTHQIHGFVYDWMNNVLIWVDYYGIRSEKMPETSFMNFNRKLNFTVLWILFIIDLDLSLSMLTNSASFGQILLLVEIDLLSSSESI